MCTSGLAPKTGCPSRASMRSASCAGVMHPPGDLKVSPQRGSAPSKHNSSALLTFIHGAEARFEVAVPTGAALGGADSAAVVPEVGAEVAALGLADVIERA